MIRLNFLGLIFLVLILVGYYLAYLYGHRTKKFNWGEYFSIIFWPSLFVVALAYFVDGKIIRLFVVSCFIGLGLEYSLGLAFHMIMGKHLWIYRRFDLDGYTSWLCLPIWGIAGVIFWYLGRIVGL